MELELKNFYDKAVENGKSGDDALKEAMQKSKVYRATSGTICSESERTDLYSTI